MAPRKDGFEVRMVTEPTDLDNPVNPEAEKLIAAAGDCGVRLFKRYYFDSDDSSYWAEY